LSVYADVTDHTVCCFYKLIDISPYLIICHHE